MKPSVAGACVALFSSFFALPAGAATLPPHGPLKLLVVSDEVNPHALSAADLTQRDDISKALNAPDAGLTLDGTVTEVYSQCVDDALSALSSAAPPDVLIYFAHQAARGCDNTEKQTALTTAFEAHLKRGGGIVVFHHGGYAMGGKDAMLQLLGVSATGNVPWDTTVGQRVFNVAPGNFVTTNHVIYAGKAEFPMMGGLGGGMRDYFDNIPDERYPGTMLLEQSGETRTILFATNSGGTRVLGYALERTGWKGRVLFYQPAEYQPNALDDRDGPNFQILANSIVYSVNQEGSGSGGTGGAAAGGSGGAGGAGPSTSGSVGDGGREPSGGAGRENMAGTTTGNGGSSHGGAGSGSGLPVAGSAPATGGNSGGGGSGASGGSPAPGGSSDDGGCGCRLPTGRTSGTTGIALALLAIGVGRRRTRR